MHRRRNHRKMFTTILLMISWLAEISLKPFLEYPREMFFGYHVDVSTRHTLLLVPFLGYPPSNTFEFILMLGIAKSNDCARCLQLKLLEHTCSLYGVVRHITVDTENFYQVFVGVGAVFRIVHPLIEK
jgi:hypothetical protein